jgi:hypothetical protein
MFVISESKFSVNNWTTQNLTAKNTHEIMSVSYSTFNMSNINYANSNSVLLICFYSQVHIDGISSQDISSKSLIQLRSSSITKFKNIESRNINASDSSAIVLIASEVQEISNHVYTNMNSASFLISESKVQLMFNLSISHCRGAMLIDRSIVHNLSLLSVSNCGYLNSVFKSGVHSRFSNISFFDCDFSNNSGETGGALYLECQQSKFWKTKIINSVFSNNTATNKGGAIYYDLYRPIMQNNTFANNSAPYGDDIASYPVKIVRLGTIDNKIIIGNVPSGLVYEDTLSLALMDQDNQIMNQESDSTIKVISSGNNSVEGIVSERIIKGVATFKGITFVDKPGVKNSKFEMTSKALDSLQILYGMALTNSSFSMQNLLHVNFRDCKPGEAERNNKCYECDYGTYSFNWRSKQCLPWMSDAVWLGGTQINVDKGFWRRSTNSSQVISWLNKYACLGGYEPENENPTKCKEGYERELCYQWGIVDNKKYEMTSEFVCSKCPDKILNAIRVTGVIIVVIIFLFITIIINVRKKKDNQFSILLRILTNYLQLISVSLSFGISIPSGFTSIFAEVGNLSSPSQPFLSFDCFAQDYEISAFAPSNQLFKSFLYSLLPLILILIAWSFIFGLKLVLNLIKSDRKLEVKRCIIISVICIIFLLHPTLTFESLRLFECKQIDENSYRMKRHLEYGCFSSEHLLWIVSVGIPIMVVWVIGMPLFALWVLIKNRNILEEMKIKQYMLLLYQGPKPNAFYWEFINSFRKLLILWVVVFMSSFNVFYQILVATCKYINLLII